MNTPPAPTPNPHWSRLDAAIVFATQAHVTKVRKGLDVPFITHPFAVAMILARSGFEEDIIAAGLLHDTVEDAGVKVAELRQHFGDAVADTVAGCSEPDKSPPWEERKRHTLEALSTAPLPVRAVTCADKLHNLRCLRVAHAAQGDEVWKHFKRGRAEQTWLFHNLAARLVQASAGQPDAALCQQLCEEVSDFFGPPLA